MPFCLRSFPDWLQDLFRGDMDEVDNFLARHRHPQEDTDELGLNVHAATEALKVGSKQKAFQLFLSQANINIVEVPSSLPYTSYYYLGPEEPRATLWIGVYKVLPVLPVLFASNSCLTLAPRIPLRSSETRDLPHTTSPSEWSARCISSPIIVSIFVPILLFFLLPILP